ncbi:MAG: hypothetical protein ABR878_03270 [Roseiarcus sp.]
MKAKNRIGVFDLLIRKHELLGTTVDIYIARSDSVDDNGVVLPTIGYEAASFAELKEVIDLLKADLDVLLEKAKQHFDP